MHVSDYHTLLRSIRRIGESIDTHTHTHADTWIVEGLNILYRRKVVLTRDTPALFLYTCDALGMLGKGVDVLLDMEQALGKWSSRTPTYLALKK